MTTDDLISDTMRSNLLTKAITSKYDVRQRVRKSYWLPEAPIRALLAKLIIEEALETARALGYGFRPIASAANITHGPPIHKIDQVFMTPLMRKPHELDLLSVVDGCCDTIYVATGALAACGVPDLPHLAEVCRANHAKFPGGEAIIDQESGKYLKPIQWTPPDHKKVRKDLRGTFDLVAHSQSLLRQFRDSESQPRNEG
jgi:predicted HAD superfamily Cof-like phosphohydrolase